MPKSGTQFQPTSSYQVVEALNDRPAQIRAVRTKFTAIAASEIHRGSCVLQRADTAARMPASRRMAIKKIKIIRTIPSLSETPSLSKQHYRQKQHRPGSHGCGVPTHATSFGAA